MRDHQHQWEQYAYKEIIDRYYYICNDCRQRRTYSGHTSRVIAKSEQVKFIKTLQELNLSKEVETLITEAVKR
jgi:hypothetical protein